MDLPVLENIEGEFEGVRIFINSADIVEFTDDNEGEHKYSATVGIWDKGIARHYYANDGIDLVGNMSISFRNQGTHFDSVIFINLAFSARSHTDSSEASVLAKFLQYFFEWFGKYLTDNNVMDMQGKEPFKMPGYSLSKADFEDYNQSH